MATVKKSTRAKLQNGKAVHSAFLIRRSKKGEYYWVLIGKNGEELSKSSESYKGLTGVKKSIASVTMITDLVSSLDDKLKFVIPFINDYKGAKKETGIAKQ